MGESNRFLGSDFVGCHTCFNQYEVFDSFAEKGEGLNHILLRISVFFFLFLALAQVSTGLMIHWIKTPQEVGASFQTTIKIVTPHLFAMGLMWFVLVHFLLFVQKGRENEKSVLSISSGISYLVYNLLPLAIYFFDSPQRLAMQPYVENIKFAAILTFQLVALRILWLCFISVRALRFHKKRVC